MALTLTVQVTPACGGDNHLNLTGTLSTGQSRTLRGLTKAALREKPTDEELDSFILVLCMFYIRQLAGTSATQIKAAIEAKTLNLTVTG
jgi:hypothetical protein